ncbi:hypothetical protein PV328_007711 [Microctonus aethiopoides]|uniref:Uncharacterized protein n=1 Tax=Microctonus aethiopoides TaxID=144406 RepID=A0AA39C9F3_9HYME|nr:hypothetical protein PV328_007711 [Microctonus aethiopoides]
MKHIGIPSLFLASKLDSAALSSRKSLESMARLHKIEVIQSEDGLIIKMSETIGAKPSNYTDHNQFRN